MDGQGLSVIVITDHQVEMAHPAFASQRIRLETPLDHHWKTCIKQCLKGVQVSPIPPEGAPFGVPIDEIHQLVRHGIHIYIIGSDPYARRELIFPPVIIGKIYRERCWPAVVHELTFGEHACQQDRSWQRDARWGGHRGCRKERRWAGSKVEFR